MGTYNNTLTRSEVGRERSMVAERKRILREQDRAEWAAEDQVIADAFPHWLKQPAKKAALASKPLTTRTEWKPKWFNKG